MYFCTNVVGTLPQRPEGRLHPPPLEDESRRRAARRPAPPPAGRARPATNQPGASTSPLPDRGRPLAEASGQASEKRRRLDELTSALQPGDRLVVSELSRLGRSLGQVVAVLDALAKAGVAFVALKEKIRVEGKRDIQTKVMTRPGTVHRTGRVETFECQR